MPTLDTSFLIDLIRQRPKAMARLEALVESGVPLATTTLNILELYRGAFLSASVHDNLREVKAISEALIHLGIDDDTYEIFGALSSERKREGNPLGEFDELIASITLANDGVIITHDRHFLQIPELTVEMY